MAHIVTFWVNRRPPALSPKGRLGVYAPSLHMYLNFSYIAGAPSVHRCVATHLCTTKPSNVSPPSSEATGGPPSTSPDLPDLTPTDRRQPRRGVHAPTNCICLFQRIHRCVATHLCMLNRHANAHKPYTALSDERRCPKSLYGV